MNKPLTKEERLHIEASRIDGKLSLYEIRRLLESEAYFREAVRDAEPIDMLLFCPNCHMQHIDAPEEGWTNPPHKSHTCRPRDGGCGTIWRPADIPTNGVRAIFTSGEQDTWRMTRHVSLAKEAAKP